MKEKVCISKTFQEVFPNGRKDLTKDPGKLGRLEALVRISASCASERTNGVNNTFEEVAIYYFYMLCPLMKNRVSSKAMFIAA